MRKPELVIQVDPCCEPLLRGFCSNCPETAFIFVNAPGSQKKIQQAFDRHLSEVHAKERQEADKYGLRRRFGHGPILGAMPDLLRT